MGNDMSCFPDQNDIPDDCIRENDAYTRLGISQAEFKEATLQHHIMPVKTKRNNRSNMFLRLQGISDTLYRIKDIERLGKILSIKPLPPANIVDLEPFKIQIEALETEKEKLLSDLRSAKKENDQLNDALNYEKEKNTELRKKTSHIEALKNDRKKLQSDLEEVKQENEHLNDALKKEKKRASRANWSKSVGVISRFCLQLGRGNIILDKKEKLKDTSTKVETEKIHRTSVEDYLKGNEVLQEALTECCSVLGDLGCFKNQGRTKTKKT